MKMTKLFFPALISLALVLSGCSSSTVPSAQPEQSAQPDDPDTEIRETVSKMTLKDKICQMIIPAFRYTEYVSGSEYETLKEMTPELKELLGEYHFGGVILFNENMETSEQSRKLIADINDANGGDFPYLIGVDQEGGSVNRIPFSTSLPGNMALGASFSDEDIYDSATIIAEELSALGFNLDFAPVADVNNEPRNSVIGTRSFSDDPKEVGECVSVFAKALQDHGIVSSLKHFPGHGDTAQDSHTGLPLVDKSYEEIQKLELIPFQTGIASGVDMIMTAHIQYPQIETEKYQAKDGSEIYLPATLSKKMLTEILRNDLGFDGVISSDSLVMDAIKEFFDPKDSVALAVNAGVNVLLMPAEYRQPLTNLIQELKDYVDQAVALTEEGKIDEKMIDDSVFRILRMKKNRGILDGTAADQNYQIGSYENHRKELEIASKSVTVIKNDDVLPITGEEKVLVLVPFESQINSAEFGLQIAREEYGSTFAGPMEVYSFGSDEADTFDANITARLNDFDVVIGVSAMYGEDDLNDPVYDYMANALQMCQSEGIRTVLISSQLPYDLGRYEADAMMACYLANGVPEIPSGYDGDVAKYGPNLVSTFTTIFTDGIGEGKLPVNVPALTAESGTFTFTDQILYPRGYSLDTNQ